MGQSSKNYLVKSLLTLHIWQYQRLLAACRIPIRFVTFPRHAHQNSCLPSDDTFLTLADSFQNYSYAVRYNLKFEKRDIFVFMKLFNNYGINVL